VKNVGISRVKSDAFQTLLSDSILACGRVENEASQGVTCGALRIGIETEYVTLVTYMVTFYVYIRKK
jgi:hypothetical protein